MKAAILLRQEKVVALLLQHGADVHVVDHLGRSPLHTAVLNASLSIVQMLLHHGADTQASSQYEVTPLQCAAWREVDSLPIVRALIDAGATIPVLVHGQRYSSPILDAAINIFGQTSQHSSQRGDEIPSFFVESDSIEQVLSTGPGGVIKFLLESEPRLQADHRFNPLLEMVACQGDIDFMQLLFERGVVVDGEGYFYGCALQAAAACGRQRCVELLLAAGADVNIAGGRKDSLRGATPLSLAVEEGHVGIAKAITEHGLDLLIHDYSSTLESAVGNNRQELVTLLLSKAGEADPTKSKRVNVRKVYGDLRAALQRACREGYLDLVKTLVQYDTDIECDHTSNNSSTNLESALGTAIACGHLPIVEFLVDTGASLYGALNGCNVWKTPRIEQCGLFLPSVMICHEASRSGYEELSQQVVEYVVEELVCTEEFLLVCKEHPAFVHHWKESIGVFLRLDQMPKTPELFHRACILGARHTVGSMLDNGMNVNINFPGGGRALQVAAYFQNFRLAEDLISRGADPQYVCSRFGSTVYAALEGLITFGQTNPQQSGIPDQAECQCSEIDVTTLEPQPHIDISGACREISTLVQSTGFTQETGIRTFGDPMHLAAYLGSRDLIEIFMTRGTDINMTGGFFGTALIAALHGNHPSIVSFLLDHGSVVHCSSAQLGSPLQVARQKYSTEMVQLLLAHGADVNAPGEGKENPFPLPFYVLKNARPLSRFWAS
jgi:ankyrin repeat protein